MPFTRGKSLETGVMLWTGSVQTFVLTTQPKTSTPPKPPNETRKRESPTISASQSSLTLGAASLSKGTCAWLERLGLIALVGHHYKYENRSPKESSFCAEQDTSGASAHCPRSGFQTCLIADFQIGNTRKLQRHLNYSRFADLEIRDTADLEVGATEGRCANAPPPVCISNPQLTVWMPKSILRTSPNSLEPGSSPNSTMESLCEQPSTSPRRC